jgi:hypothetical protein
MPESTTKIEELLKKIEELKNVCKAKKNIPTETERVHRA